MIGNMQGLSKHRIEALTDGIHAIAMTLLVLMIVLGRIGRRLEAKPETNP